MHHSGCIMDIMDIVKTPASSFADIKVYYGYFHDIITNRIICHASHDLFI